MNTLKWHHIFLTLVCLTLMLAMTIGIVQAGTTPPAESDFAAVDAYVHEQRKALGIPGLALGIVRGDQIAHLQGFGVADSSGRTVTPQTPFHIGSVTKPFTALAVMQLVEQGKIDLDAPVQTYLPWFELADQEASSKITVRNLLNHTTGISEKDGNRFWPSRQGLEETVHGLGTLPLTRPVGSAWQYSNINFSIAGLIVEKASGQTYADYVTQHIFKPLDMRHSYASHALALADGLSDGHYYMFGHALQRDGPLPRPYLPSGLLISTAEDMAHFAIAQLNDGKYSDTSILSPQGMVEMHTPEIAMQRGDYRYAIGWAAGTVGGIPLPSMLVFYPELGSALVIIAILGIGWSIIYTALYLRTRIGFAQSSTGLAMLDRQGTKNGQTSPL